MNISSLGHSQNINHANLQIVYQKQNWNNNCNIKMGK